MHVCNEIQRDGRKMWFYFIQGNLRDGKIQIRMKIYANYIHVTRRLWKLRPE